MLGNAISVTYNVPWVRGISVFVPNKVSDSCSTRWIRLWDIRNTWGQSIPKKRTLMSKVGYIWLWMDNKSLCMLVFDWPKNKKGLKMTKYKKYWQSHYLLNFFFFVGILKHINVIIWRWCVVAVQKDKKE